MSQVIRVEKASNLLAASETVRLQHPDVVVVYDVTREMAETVWVTCSWERQWIVDRKTRPYPA